MRWVAHTLTHHAQTSGVPAPSAGLTGHIRWPPGHGLPEAPRPRRELVGPDLDSGGPPHNTSKRPGRPLSEFSYLKSD